MFNQRASGLLLHVTSLPSHYGIGDMGPAAALWIDRLAESGQSWWQSLPLGPTGYGNSPYQPLSSFAGNELVISPDWLIEDGLLESSDSQPIRFRKLKSTTTPSSLSSTSFSKNAWTNFHAGGHSDLRPAFEQFCQDQAHWLNDYALFRALKAKFSGAYYLDWPKELVDREPGSARQSQAGTGGSNRIGALCPIPIIPSSRPPEGARAQQGRKLDRRPALLRLSRFQ